MSCIVSPICDVIVFSPSVLYRKLGELGQKDGSSLILCHIQDIYEQTYRLSVASTGLGEAILCRSGRAVPLTSPHSPSSNTNEMMRVADARGFVSQVSEDASIPTGSFDSLLVHGKNINH